MDDRLRFHDELLESIRAYRRHPLWINLYKIIYELMTDIQILELRERHTRRKNDQPCVIVTDEFAPENDWRALYDDPSMIPESGSKLESAEQAAARDNIIQSDVNDIFCELLGIGLPCPGEASGPDV